MPEPTDDAPELTAEEIGEQKAVRLGKRARLESEASDLGGGAYPGLNGSYQVLEFPWPSDPGLAYVEHAAATLGEQIVKAILPAGAQVADVHRPPADPGGHRDGSDEEHQEQDDDRRGHQPAGHRLLLPECSSSREASHVPWLATACRFCCAFCRIVAGLPLASWASAESKAVSAWVAPAIAMSGCA